MIKYNKENKKRNFIFEVKTIITHIWVLLEEYWLQGIFIHREPMLYKRLFRKGFVTGKDKFAP